MMGDSTRVVNRNIGEYGPEEKRIYYYSQQTQSDPHCEFKGCQG